MHYTQKELAARLHPCDLQPTNDVVLSIDYKQLSLGNNSCGSPPLWEYIIRPRREEFSYALRPWQASMKNPFDQARPQFPVAGGVTIERGKNNRVTLRCMNPAAKIHYTTDGSQPRADSPIYPGEALQLSKGDELNVVARLQNLFGPVSTVRF